MNNSESTERIQIYTRPRTRTAWPIGLAILFLSPQAASRCSNPVKLVPSLSLLPMPRCHLLDRKTRFAWLDNSSSMIASLAQRYYSRSTPAFCWEQRELVLSDSFLPALSPFPTSSTLARPMEETVLFHCCFSHFCCGTQSHKFSRVFGSFLSIHRLLTYISFTGCCAD